MKRLLCAVFAALLFLAGCGGTQQDAPKTIHLWTHWDGRELDLLRSEIAAFEQEHEGVRVELTVKLFETFSRDVEQAMRRGGSDAPDVFAGINDWIGNFAEKNLILPIDNLPNESPEEFLPYAYEACKHKDHLYGFPLSYECLALFYNRDLVKSAPKTVPEWIKSARRLSDPVNDRWGLVYDLSKPYFNMAWLLASGEPLLKAGGAPALDGPDKVRWLERIKAMQDVDRIVPPRQSGWQDRSVELFTAGRAAFFLGGPWDIPAIRESGVAFGITRLPKTENGRWLPPLIGVKALFLTGKGDMPVSRELIRFLGRAALQRRFAVEAARIPSLKIIYEDPVILKNESLLAFADQASVGEPMPTEPEMYAVWQPLQDLAFRPYLEGKISARSGLTTAQKAAEEEIARYRAEMRAW